MDLAGISAALKGMFRLRANSPAQEQVLANLEELRAVGETIRKAEHSFEDAVNSISDSLS